MEEKNDIFKVDENQHKKDNQKKIVFVLGTAIVIVVMILTIVLVNAIVSVGRNNKETTKYQTTAPVTQPTTTKIDFGALIGDADVQAGDNNATVESGDDAVDGEGTATATQEASDNINNIVDTPTDTTKNAIIESYENLSVNGENVLSDHYNNEFIKLISDEYGVDADLLVAIYSVPDTGTNYVLQFDGDKNLKGEYVKSPDTLEKVYYIDLNKNIQVATGKPTGNEGVSYAESVMTFAMVKTIVMKQYPHYFTGLN